MAQVQKKTTIPTAVVDRSQLNLSSRHVTTGNFYENTISKFLLLAPKQTVDINHRQFVRLEPLAKPTNGSANIINRTFFVPFRTVMRGFNDFIDDIPHTDSFGVQAILANTPQISNSMFVSLLTDSRLSTKLFDTTDYDEALDSVSDIVVLANGTYTAYKFKPFGSRVYKILWQLGYRVIFHDTPTPVTHCALNFLAYVRIYLDWYFPAKYRAVYDTSKFESWLNFDSTEDDFENGVGLSVGDLVEFFEFSSLCAYRDDFFVNTWERPSGPNSGSFSEVSIRNPDLNQSLTNQDAGGVGVLDSITGQFQPGTAQQLQNNVFSQFTINALKALTDYMKRHQIAGARTLDRYLSRWGVQLSSEKLNRSVYLNKTVTSIDFADVTSMSDTTAKDSAGIERGASLGSYAGKGIGYGQGGNKFSTDEHGLLLIVTNIIPEIDYYQGADRSTMLLSKLDFYTPEFDNLGVDALSTREIFVSSNSADAVSSGANLIAPSLDYNKLIFGYAPRYYYYKRSNSMLSGDYVLGTRNKGRDSWHLFRDLRDYSSAVGGIDKMRSDIQFNIAYDEQQYDRIFQYTGDDADKFNIFNIFDIQSSFPGKKLYDTYDFTEQEKADKVVMDVNGTTFS